APMLGVSRRAGLRASEVLPTATNRPALTAKACAVGRAASCVRTRAFTSIKSGDSVVVGRFGGAVAAPLAPAPSDLANGSLVSVAAPARSALKPRNSPRVYLRMRKYCALGQRTARVTRVRSPDSGCRSASDGE